MKYLKKYSITIIAALAFLLALKSCQSCSRSRALDWAQMEYTECVDSLNHVVSDLRYQNMVAEDSIKMLNAEIGALKEMNGMMQGSLDHARATNNSLVRSINKDK